MLYLSAILFTFFGDKCFSTAICEPYILAQCHGASINKNVDREATSEYAANPDLNINNNNMYILEALKHGLSALI